MERTEVGIEVGDTRRGVRRNYKLTGMEVLEEDFKNRSKLEKMTEALQRV